MYGNDLSAKIQSLAQTCESLEGTFSLQDARAWPIVDALMDVWQGCQLALQDLQNNQVQLQVYIVPKTQTLTECAIDIYGDASRAGDLLGLNPQLADVLTIQATTQIRYYPDTSGSSSIAA